MEPAAKTVSEPGMGVVEIFQLDTSEALLIALLEDIFENHWRDIRFGVNVQGAVYEIRAPNPPVRISLSDGYLTVDFGPWHFHLCIGEYRGSPTRSADSTLAQYRRTARAELYRLLGEDGTPTGWGLRLFNGGGEQQLTVFLPHPFLTDDDRIMETPEWSRLALWDHLRKSFLGLETDAKDRTSQGFACGKAKDMEAVPARAYMDVRSLSGGTITSNGGDRPFSKA